jgi:hypothetical protein
MRENEDFLEERLIKEGSTNLGIYFLKYRDEKKLKIKEQPSNIMLPPEARIMLPPEAHLLPQPEAQPRMVPPDPHVINPESSNSILANYQKQMQQVQ